MSATARVLLVEDEVSIRTMFHHLLGSVGYAVVAVPTSEEALVQLDCGVFDLLITDYQLPGLSGEALIQEVNRRQLPMKTLLMSANPDLEMVGARCHADATFFKTTSLVHLLEMIEQIVRPHQ